MVKKRQTDAHDATSSTDSGEDDRHHLHHHHPGARSAGQAGASIDGSSPSSSSCQHIKRAVDATRLRRQLKTTGLVYECSQCQKQGQQKQSADADSDPKAGDIEYDSTLWLCLKCGTQLCGRSRNKHALEHHQTPRSESHALAMNTRSFDIWCYECDMKICSNQRKNLLECVELVKRLAQKPPASPNPPTISNIEMKIKSTVEQLTSMAPLAMAPGTSVGTFDESSAGAAGGGTRSSQVAIPLPPPPPNAAQASAAGPSTLTSVPGMAKRIGQPNGAAGGAAVGIRAVAGDTLRNDLDRLPRVRGLTNLGNTCFFNAVMQCLAQTPFLLSVMRELAEPGEEFVLPGGTFNFKDKGDVELPMIKGTLSSWGGLTAALANALEELQAGGGVFTPSKLFDKLCTKCPQFTGGDQHDAHELLRQLLESVRNEDLKRYQRVILQNLGYKDQEISSVSEEMRQKCKIYGNQAGERILRPDQVFRGFLVSTLTCQDCHSVSSRHEYFLDMSLPVAVEKPQPPQRRKPSPEHPLISQPIAQPAINTKFTAGESGVSFTASPSSSFYLHSDQTETATLGPSKTQVKKEKERERKAKRAAKHQRHKQAQKLSLKLNGSDLADSASDAPQLVSLGAGDGQGRIEGGEQPKEQGDDTTSSSVTTSEHSDADVEDNLVEDSAPVSASANTASSSASTSSGGATGSKFYTDSNGNAQPVGEKRDDTPEHMDKDSLEEDENDSGIATSPAPTATSSSSTVIAGDSLTNNSGASSGTLEDTSAPASLVSAGLSEKGASLIRQFSNGGTPLESDTQVSVELEKLNLEGLDKAQNQDENQSQAQKVSDQLLAQAQAQAQASARAKRVRTQSYSDWSTTIAPRYQCEDGECSVQSCLNNFTAVELMTGQNKVGCDSCTLRINGSDPKAKSVNTNATKQLLVSSPPAVLILHLKRFQLGPRCIFRKLTRPVSYPNLLDIAAFCGSKVKNLPNIDRKQKKLLYALYGVVEHSGGMYGGHYTAYVKVRPKVTPDDKRWKFLPHGSKAELDQDDDQLKKLEELLAKEKARELHLNAMDDSDDFSNSSSNSSTSDEGNAPPTPTEEQQQQAASPGEEAAHVQAPPGKWYYVSDSRVQEVSEDSALKAQAYLLFYERIY
ncbi:ubiquitin carboxyl-terminal hydrolase 16/45 isoform X2 [Drosophila bipectinata]|nr:ubiquitin carboxyl-terminal hydrolase 45 [Drosophila bipectinata]